LASDTPDDKPDTKQEVVSSSQVFRGNRAGAGRGSADDPRRLDYAYGPKIQAVEKEVSRLKEINPQAQEKELRG
jgi:hypothetical protein